MLRLGATLAALGLTSALVVGCFDASPALLPTGAECGGLTVEDAADCAGGVCLGLEKNAQGMAGLCSAGCYVDSDCSPHERCLSTSEGYFCMRLCATDDDCYDDFVCRGVFGDSHKYCLVDPVF